MAGDCGLNALSLLPENVLPQWQQKIAMQKIMRVDEVTKHWTRLFSAGIGPAHFLAETTRPLVRGCLHFHLLLYPISVVCQEAMGTSLKNIRKLI